MSVNDHKLIELERELALEQKATDTVLEEHRNRIDGLERRLNLERQERQQLRDQFTELQAMIEKTRYFE